MQNNAQSHQGKGTKKEFHIVSLTISSFVGLVIFPFERSKATKKNDKKIKEYGGDFVIPNAALSDLRNEGWPEWQQEKKKLDSLETLLKNMRHAVAHGNVKFSGDQRSLEEVEISFENWHNGKPIWIGKMRGDQLFVFCQKLCDWILVKTG